MSWNHIAGSMWSAYNMRASEPAWDPARSLFLSPQPLYNTKRSPRRRLNPPDFTYSLKKIIMAKWYLSQNQQHITPFSEKEEMWVNREFLTNWKGRGPYQSFFCFFFSLPHVVKMPRTLCILLHVLIHNNDFVLSQTSSIRFQPLRIRVDVAWVTVGHLSLVVSSQVSFLLEFYLGNNRSFYGGTVLLTT